MEAMCLSWPAVKVEDGGEKNVTRDADSRELLTIDQQVRERWINGRDVDDCSLMTAGGFQVIVRPSWD